MLPGRRKNHVIRLIVYPAIVVAIVLTIHYLRKPEPTQKTSPINLPPDIRLVELSDGVITPRSWSFRSELPSHPQLQKLRKREKLDTVISPGADEFEKMVLLRSRVNSQWKSGAPRPYPPWNANKILEMIRSGQTEGFCAQYAVVLAQAARSLGWQSRYLDVATGCIGSKRGHVTVEVWSNQFNKWVVMDPFFDCHFIRDGIPLSALELHRAVAEEGADAVKLVRGEGKYGKSNSNRSDSEIKRLFKHIAADMRSDHLSRPLHFWDRADGYIAWKDRRTDGCPQIYKQITEDEREFNFPLNQVEIILKPLNEKGKLRCLIRTNMKEAEFLEISEDGSDWRQYRLHPANPSPPLGVTLTVLHGATFTYPWKLGRGKNSLSVRAVNSMGVSGPPAMVKVEYKPE